MSRPTVDPALEKRLDALMEEAFDARDGGDPAAAVMKWEEAWALLPEPKLTWDYYPQGICLDVTRALIELGRLSEAATWVERLDEAYSPHSDASRMLVDFEKAKLYFRAGQPDLAHAYFDAIYRVKGQRVFDAVSPDYLEFYRSHTPGSPDGDPGGVRVPAPEPGRAGGALDDATHRRVVELLADGDRHLDLDAPRDAADRFVEAIEALPQPFTQWEAALQLTTALGDACLALTQYAEAEQTLRLALESPGGKGNPYVWLRLGDALHGQSRDGEALEAWTSAYALGGEELLEGEDDAIRALDAAGIRKG